MEIKYNMNNKIEGNRIKDSKISTKLSKEQRDAVFYSNRNLLVTAGPGRDRKSVV